MQEGAKRSRLKSQFKQRDLTNRKKWEHHIRMVDPHMIMEFDTRFTEMLNQFGDWGWEVVSVNYGTGMVIFKRPKE